MTEPTALRDLAEEDSKSLALYLKQYLKLHSLTGTDASRALERSSAYLTQVFSGQVPLKLKDLFGALAQTRPHPQAFFDRFYSSHNPSRPKSPGGALAKLEELGLRLERPAYRRSAQGTTDRAGHLLSAWIVGAGQKQRPISRALGLGADTLAKALRNETDLAAWHLFGVLRAIKGDPAAFFEELLAIEEPDGLSDSDAHMLARVLEATLAGLKARSAAGQRGNADPGNSPGVKSEGSTQGQPGLRGAAPGRRKR